MTVRRAGLHAPPCGFTLTEVLVAVAICGIAGAVAYPNLLEHVTRARRTEAQGALQRLMQQEERYFTLHNRYVAFAPDSTDGDARLFRWWSGTSPERSAYEISGRACDDRPLDDCVQLVATPGTARVDVHFRDGTCGQLILTSTGERRASGAGPRCWR